MDETTGVGRNYLYNVKCYCYIPSIVPTNTQDYLHSLCRINITMIESASPFVASSIPLLYNVVKSIIFKCAELLIALFIYKVFSFIVSRSN